MSDRHAPDNLKITIRARRDWIAQLDAAARAAGESRMAYIRQAVEERMERERRDEK
jgi:predicted transcriptional regulator